MSTEAEEMRDLAASLMAMNLLTEAERFTVAKMAGGVSCDVWRIDVEHRTPIVVKRALPKLRVEADWRAPVERAETEVEWIRTAARVNPDFVPRLLGQDQNRHMFAMAYLPSLQYPVWKYELAAGCIDLGFAAAVGRALATIHAATAASTKLASTFDNATLFYALRLEPYLLFTAKSHPTLAIAIEGEAIRIAKARIALMHGDISPKNILCGPSGPVFIDAETACFGDPVFDLAFCLNHLLLKSVWHGEWTEQYAQSFLALKNAYLAHVTWEEAGDVDARTSRLLPMLFLARVDGKSPAEYLTSESDRSFVRAAAIQMIVEPPISLDVLAQTYFAVAASR